jgi:predicted phage tail protein
MTSANVVKRRLILSGEMGKKFGRIHHVHLDSNTPAEAVSYLLSQFPTSAAYLTGAKDRGIGFAVFAGKRNLSEDDLKFPVGSEDIRIAPILMGSKNAGVFQIILGAVLIIVGAFAEGLSAGTSTQLIIAGIGMVAGGVVQMLAPHPHGLSSADRAANQPSYSFNGPVNTEAQGHPVPLLYGGPMKVGSAVISAGISVADTAAAYQPPKVGSGHMGYGGDLYGTKVLAP